MTGIELLNERNCSYIQSSSREPGQPAFSTPESPLSEQTLSAFTVNMPSEQAPEEDASATRTCRYNEDPCPTESPFRRKVISHIFGRNKTCTLALPDWIWVYYCRKHYQRAKYRMDGWGVHQCDLAIHAVEGMQEWGGVASFNVELRRRELERTSSEGKDQPEIKSETPATDAETPETPERTLTAASASPQPVNEPDELSSASPASLATSTLGANGKKGPTIIPCPVPKWLREHVGKNKSFDDVFSILEAIRTELVPAKDNPATVKDFPDIELLPNIKPQFLPVAPVAEKKPRVNKKGAVKKVRKEKRPGGEGPGGEEGSGGEGLGGLTGEGHNMA